MEEPGSMEESFRKINTEPSPSMRAYPLGKVSRRAAPDPASYESSESGGCDIRIDLSVIDENKAMDAPSSAPGGISMDAIPFSPPVRVVAPMMAPLRRSITAPASLDVRCKRGKVERAIGKCNIPSKVSEQAEAQVAWVEQQVSLLEQPDERAFVATEVRKSSVCSLLEESKIDRIVHNMKYFTFAKGKTLVRRGDDGKYFFILREGQLAVLSNDGSSERRTMGPGEASGEDALLFGSQQPATIVAKEDSCVWGLQGDTFRKVFNENSSQQNADNFRLLDSLNIFEGCSEQQKLDLGRKFNLFTEVVPAGTVVVEEGQVVSAIYLVKEGELTVWIAPENLRTSSGSARSASKQSSSKDREKVKTLYAGESFGKQSALHGRPSRISVVAEASCQLVRIGIEQLREELGQNLEEAIQTSILIERLDLSPFLSQFTLTQRRHIVAAMEITDYEPDVCLEESLEFVIVLKGSLRHKEDTEDFLCVPDLRESKSLLRSKRGDDMVSRVRSRSRSLMLTQQLSDTLNELGSLEDLIAGPHGARIATLKHESLAQALEKAGISSKTVDVIEYAKRMLLAKKIPLFLPLTSEQVDMLVDSIIVVRHGRGDVIFEQGSPANAFWIIAQGEAEAVGDGGKLQHVFRKHSQVGVRSLLNGAPRDTTVRVSSRSAELWQLERETFDSLITGKAREELKHHYELIDTDVELRDLKHVCLIGTGGFGSVRQVQHLRYPHLKYALKRVRRNLGEKVVDMVARECRLLAEMDHPLILLQVKTFQTSASIYNLTELLEGGELLNALNHIGRPLTREEAQFYAGSLVLVLDALADQRVIYRDLKPENVMLDSQGYIKLIDFGSAKKLEGTEARTFTVIGSYHFMAPEVTLGQGYGLEADVWSLGIMIFEFVCGHLPFGSSKTSPVEICTAVKTQNLSFPKWYRDTIGKHLMRGMLRREPSERLGYGVDGILQMKEHDFFHVEDKDEDGDLFQRLLSRQLEPPHLPHGDEYLQMQEREVVLSDADELG
mmetsp:Transcript_129799/g.224249  ORF Transcript_129799/g.224249 Transcript_129799/m.224249 type:complete len:1009 (+) Transcript_129799:54-3080(+)